MPDPNTQPPRNGDAFSREVGVQEARKLKARRNPGPSVLLGFGVFGVIGWSIALPTLIGALAGMWLDKNHPGEHSWTLALLIGGLTLGCLNALNWLAREHRSLHHDEEHRAGAEKEEGHD